jgi:hypothetical protein
MIKINLRIDRNHDVKIKVAINLKLRDKHYLLIHAIKTYLFCHFLKCIKMKSTTDLKEKGKQSLESFRSLFDELRVQAALGKAEAKELIDEERKNLYDYISKERALLRQTAQLSVKHEQDLMDKFAALQNELDNAVPDTKRKFDNYKKVVLQNIYDLEFAIKTESHDVRKSLQRNLNTFKTKLDAYRLQVAMSDYENRENLNNRKSELIGRINEIRSMVKDRQAEDKKWEYFSEEVSESYQHLKKAFSDLLA